MVASCNTALWAQPDCVLLTGRRATVGHAIDRAVGEPLEQSACGQHDCSTAGTFYWAVWLARRSRTVGAGRHWRDQG
jgi:hypothetical protein